MIAYGLFITITLVLVSANVDPYIVEIFTLAFTADPALRLKPY